MRVTKALHFFLGATVFLLRFLVKSILAILAVPVLLLLCLLLVNSFDEQLEPKTLQWLAYAPVPVPDTSNAFHALMSLDAQVEDPMAAAEQMLHGWRELYRAQPNFLLPHPDYESVRQSILHPLHQSIDPLLDCKLECYRRIVEHADRLKTLEMEQAPALARFDEMLDLPEYSDDTVWGNADTPIADYRPALQLSLLYLAQVVFDVQAGKADQACRNWARNQSFWYRAAHGARNLIGVAVPGLAVDRGVEILQRLAADNAAFAAVARNCAAPVLERGHELTADMAKAQIGEFQLEADALANDSVHCPFWDLSQCRIPGRPWKWYERFELILFRKNASLNLARQQRENVLARAGVQLNGYQFSHAPQFDGQCTWWTFGWLRPYNPIGRLLICVDDKQNVVDSYLQKIRNTVASSDQAITALQSSGL